MNQSYVILPVLVSWEIWKARNLLTFKGISLSIWVIVLNILVAFREWCPDGIQARKSSNRLKSPPSMPENGCKGLFDGSSQRNDSIGGASAIICLNEYKSFKLKMNYGEKTNSRCELLALWMLLFFANHLGIKDIHVGGDSKVIIVWVNEKSRLHVMSLLPWMQKIRVLMTSFENSSFICIHVVQSNDRQIIQGSC